jgi:FkbM family methyltransferase
MNLVDQPNTMVQTIALKIATALSHTYFQSHFRGYGRINNFLENTLGPKLFTTEIHTKSLFCFRLFDPYWNQLLTKEYVYEPEITTFLKSVMSSNVAFIDCGANYGYWTLFALEILPDHRVISVEASPATFARLSANVALNGRKPLLLNRAISENSGETVEFLTVGKNHAGAAVHGKKKIDRSQTSSISIQTINLAKILAGTPKSDAYLIKLDVEGCEIEAIMGLGVENTHDPVMIVFEEIDHNCAVSDYFLNSINWEVFALRDDGSITSLDLDAAKAEARKSSNPTNFLAVNSAGRNALKVKVN